MSDSAGAAALPSPALLPTAGPLQERLFLEEVRERVSAYPGTAYSADAVWGEGGIVSRLSAEALPHASFLVGLHAPPADLWHALRFYRGTATEERVAALVKLFAASPLEYMPCFVGGGDDYFVPLDAGDKPCVEAALCAAVGVCIGSDSRCGENHRNRLCHVAVLGNYTHLARVIDVEPSGISVHKRVVARLREEYPLVDAVSGWEPSLVMRAAVRVRVPLADFGELARAFAGDACGGVAGVGSVRRTFDRDLMRQPDAEPYAHLLASVIGEIVSSPQNGYSFVSMFFVPRCVPRGAVDALSTCFFDRGEECPTPGEWDEALIHEVAARLGATEPYTRRFDFGARRVQEIMVAHGVGSWVFPWDPSVAATVVDRADSLSRAVLATTNVETIASVCREYLMLPRSGTVRKQARCDASGDTLRRKRQRHK
jgi:hypothetical protein